MTNDELIDLYDRDQQRRGLLPATRAMRRRQLRLIGRELGPFEQITHQQIDRWLDTRSNRLGEPISSKTRSCWLTSISSFYAWTIRDGELEINPTAKIIRPKIRKRGPRPIPTKDLERAIAAASGELRAWLTLESYEGLRCQEACWIAREDVDAENMTLRVTHGKGSHERMLPLHPKVLDALTAYGLPPEGRLFPNATPSGVSQRINRHLHGLGIQSTAHSLRHWFGTSLYRSSKDLRLVQELLGHSSPATTAIYAAADTSTAAEAVRKLRIGE